MSKSTTYFITGANRGIGFAITEKLSSDPSNKLIVTVRDESKAHELAKLAEATGNINVITLDVGDRKSIDKIDEQVRNITDKIDIFISNAGISSAYYKMIDAPIDIWQKHIDINTLGPIFVFQKLHKYLAKSEIKKVIFVSSIAASVGAGFDLNTSAYGVSKAGLNFAVYTLSHELRAEGFTIFPIHPGVVLSDMGNESIEEFDKNEGFNFSRKISIETNESAESIIKVIDTADRSYSGKFYSYDGSVIPY